MIIPKETCCFTGHRNIVGDINDIQDRVSEEVLKLINLGVKNFICGGAMGFDILCGEIILRIRQFFDIKLIMALPCKNQNKYYDKINKEKYSNLLLNANEIIYTSNCYYSGCMHKRNRYMVDNSKYVVSYCKFNKGGTYYTKTYAKSKKAFIIEVS